MTVIRPPHRPSQRKRWKLTPLTDDRSGSARKFPADHDCKRGLASRGMCCWRKKGPPEKHAERAGPNSRVDALETRASRDGVT